MTLLMRNEQTLDLEQKLELKTIFHYRYAVNAEKLRLRAIYMIKWADEHSRVIAFNKNALKVFDEIFEDETKTTEALLKVFGKHLKRKGRRIDWLTGSTNPDILSLLLDIPVMSKTKQSKE
jgi:hypothetical protein